MKLIDSLRLGIRKVMWRCCGAESARVAVEIREWMCWEERTGLASTEPGPLVRLCEPSITRYCFVCLTHVIDEIYVLECKGEDMTLNP